MGGLYCSTKMSKEAIDEVIEENVKYLQEKVVTDTFNTDNVMSENWQQVYCQVCKHRD